MITSSSIFCLVLSLLFFWDSTARVLWSCRVLRFSVSFLSRQNQSPPMCQLTAGVALTPSLQGFCGWVVCTGAGWGQLVPVQDILGFGWKAGGEGRVLWRGLLVRDGVGPTRRRRLRVKCEHGREGAGRGHPPDDSSG